MTTLAYAANANMLDRLGAAAAGPLADDVARLTLRALQDLKVTISAGSSWVFNDLHTLCDEKGGAKAFTLAQRFLLALPSNLPAPELDIDDDGDVVFDWAGPPDRLMSVALNPDGRITFAARLSANRARHGSDYFSDAIPHEILDLLAQITS